MGSSKKKLGLVALVAAAIVVLPGCLSGPSREQVLRSQSESDLGIGLWQEHNIAGAFEHLLEAIRLDPENAEAHLMLGNLFMMNRADYERAEHHFREAMRANQAHPVRAGLEADAKNSLGVLYIHAQRYDDATEVLRESARDLMNRDPAIAWTNLGWAYLELQRHAEAREVLAQAVQLQPHLCVAWYRLGQVHVAESELEQADQALSRALDVENETCHQLQVAWRLRGEVRATLGHRDDAIQDLERCVELSGNTEDGAACQRLLASAD